jgi:hypothetical protein
VTPITVITWLDVWALQSALWRQQKQLDGDAARRLGSQRDTRTLVFRGPNSDEAWDSGDDDAPCEDTALLGLKEWLPLKRLLARAGTALTTPAGPPEFGRIFLESLLPKGHVDWHSAGDPYSHAHHRFHCALVTNPAAMLYAGLQSAHLAAGQVALVDQSMLTSAVNFGVRPRIHLVVDVRRPEEI